jgi:hypothetical protein
MAEEKSSGLDVLGVKPVAESINKLVSGAVDGLSAVLGRLCLPAADELGLLFRDKVSYYRACNLLKLTKKIEQKMADKLEGVQAPPRLVHSIVEEASWIEDSDVQDMWAGLLSSACTDKGDDDSNLIFVDLLSRMTKLQARILRFACMEAEKIVTFAGLIYSEHLTIPFDRLCEIASERDIDRLDREMDYLREMGLLEGGFSLITRMS